MELFKASKQWASRPVDERFWSLGDMAVQCRSYQEQAQTSTIAYKDLRLEAVGDELQLVGRTGTPAQLTHWAMAQVAQRAKAPVDYLRSLPATLAGQNLNHGLKQRASDDEAKLLFHKRNGDGLLLRCATSDRYTRIWNHEVCERLIYILPNGWQTPPASPSVNDSRARPATTDDCIDQNGNAFSIKPGDMIAPAGLYASDHDMFVFLVNTGCRIHHDQLSRGFFCWNSEVGAMSFGVCKFLFNHICGNHIVWGAKNVQELRIRHVGDANDRAFGQLGIELIKYADESSSDEEAKIKSAQSFVLGKSKDEALDELFGIVRKRRINISQQSLKAAYCIAEKRSDDYGSPRALWGVVNGLTELSQSTAYADRRVELDRAAGKLLDIAF